MKQNEEEWKEYHNVMEDVIKRSGLSKEVFYDLRGNHDNFGVPVVGGSSDFFSKYSINGQLGRSRRVNSVTVEVSNSLLSSFYEIFQFFLLLVDYVALCMDTVWAKAAAIVVACMYVCMHDTVQRL